MDYNYNDIAAVEAAGRYASHSRGVGYYCCFEEVGEDCLEAEQGFSDWGAGLLNRLRRGNELMAIGLHVWHSLLHSGPEPNEPPEWIELWRVSPLYVVPSGYVGVGVSCRTVALVRRAAAS